MKATCTICSKIAFSNGYCAKHYFRWKRNGDPLRAKCITQKIYKKDNHGVIEIYSPDNELLILAIFDSEDIKRVQKLRWNYVKKNKKIRAIYPLILLDRYLMRIDIGEKKNYDFIHINKNNTDYRKDNLLLLSRPIITIKNNIDKKKIKYIGVWKQKNRFYSSLSYKGTKIFLGGFANPEQAALAYNRKSEELFGENGVLNKIKNKTKTKNKKKNKYV